MLERSSIVEMIAELTPTSSGEYDRAATTQ